MCVAAVIRKPISAAYLQSMHDDNPHGGGVAWLAPDGSGIRFAKGLNAKQIHFMQETKLLTFPYLLHFRWATHGGICDELTHPFPTGHRALMGELSGVARQVLIHNGTWHKYSEWVDYLRGDIPDSLLDAASDTAIAAFLYEDFPEIGDEVPWAVATAKVVNGKLDITFHGDSWTEHEGNDYSNLSWLPYKYWSQDYKNSRRIRYPHLSHYSTYGSVTPEEGWDDWIDYWRGRGVDAKDPRIVELEDLELAELRDDSSNNSTKQLVKHLDAEESWSDYIRRRYGDETLAEVARDYEASEQSEQDMPPDGIDLDSPELVSDDPAVVEAWLDRQQALEWERMAAARDSVRNSVKKEVA